MKVAMINTSIRLKPEVVPHIFECQSSRSTSHNNGKKRYASIRRAEAAAISTIISANQEVEAFDQFNLDDNSLAVDPDLGMFV